MLLQTESNHNSCSYVTLFICFSRLTLFFTENCVCCSLVEEGFQEGSRVGKISGYRKGFALGVEYGSEINQEVCLAYF